jgi:hypothetical protein
MHNRWRVALAFCLGLQSLGCAGPSSDVTGPPQQPTPPASPPPGPSIPNPPGLGKGARVLFIGNSLTQVNDLPAMVRAMADAAGLDWDIQEQLQGGASLEDHWNSGIAPDRIRGAYWDAVVLQQGPSSLPESRTNLRQWVKAFDALVRASGGTSALYEVWPEHERFAWYDRVRDSYALAARDVSGWFLPAGEAWRAAWRQDASLALYGSDGFHPTVAGTYAAAVTIFAGLSGRSALDASGVSGLDDSMAERLRQAAQDALEQYGDYGPANAP